MNPDAVSPVPAGPVSVSSQPGLTRREVDLAATQAAFEARSWHGAVLGTVPVTRADVLVDDAGRPVSVDCELDLTGLTTGNRRRDKDLRSRRFFDAARHPVMLFSAADIVSSVDGWQVRGVLSIGLTDCPLVMHVSQGGEFYDGFTGIAHVTTHELGVRAPRFLIREHVTLMVTTRFS
jgi:polyisoprenoid-binding protein YceI